MKIMVLDIKRKVIKK